MTLVLLKILPVKRMFSIATVGGHPYNTIH